MVWKLAGEMMMMKMKFTDIVFGVKKMTNVSSNNHQGSGVLKIHKPYQQPFSGHHNPKKPYPSPPLLKTKGQRKQQRLYYHHYSSYW